MALVDYFLKIEGIEGESQDAKHKNEIQVESFAWGEQNAGTAAHGGGMGAGKVNFNDFNFAMRLNKASPVLFQKCATGEHIKSAILTCRKAGKEQQEYLKVTFSDLLVSNYQTGGSAGNDVVPMDSISLNFTKVEIEYKEQKKDGTLGGAIKKSYDIKEQKAA
ncbi:MAG TPA: type VI secretion system tube protein Hcp [Terriglobales bacterium]|nr:type VI secretion system tube protein Hcp [Terriglobales bacterium]